ncbi:MAG: TonB-dependent receptor [Bacteroidota bacterium]
MLKTLGLFLCFASAFVHPGTILAQHFPGKEKLPFEFRFKEKGSGEEFYLSAGTSVKLVNKGGETVADTVINNFSGSKIVFKIYPEDYVIIIKNSNIKPVHEKVLISGPNSNGFHNIYVERVEKHLDEVEIHADPSGNSKRRQTLFNAAKVGKTSPGETLGESLKEIPGITVYQTGGTIQKPVIRGQSGNRIYIMNNGVKLEAQQWGNEHAPELDPNTGETSVLKGTAGIAYGAEAMGGVILSEPAKISGNKAGISMSGNSNGRGVSATAFADHVFTGITEGLKIRMQGTFKRAGNLRAARYYLDNTAMREGDFSALAEYSNKGMGAELYYSLFNSDLGILSASHIGSTEDLDLALRANKPLTPDRFSYTIGRPYQQVMHNFAKARLFGNPATGSLEAVYAFQQNTRQEFDYIPLNGTLKPALWLSIATNSLDLNYKQDPLTRLHGSAGINLATQGNKWDGRFFIPNFRTYGAGAYAIERMHINENLLLEAGVRADYRWQRAFMYQILGNANSPLLKPTHTYSNVSASLGMQYKFSDAFLATLNVGTAWRPPAINELYSNGIHQSAASYDVGNPNLSTEKVRSLSLDIDYHGAEFTAEASIWYNNFNGYIWLRPTLNTRQTIRGTFPEFAYSQCNAAFTGFDAFINYAFTPGLSVYAKPALIMADNLSASQPMNLVPANRLDFGLTFRHNFGKKVNAAGRQIPAELSAGSMFVAKQMRVPANSDYAASPAAYNLLYMKLSGEFKPGNSVKSILSFKANNLLNRAYRDYQNRFRYFADDIGSSYIITLALTFYVKKPKQESITG